MQIGRNPKRSLNMKEDILTGFFVREELIPYLNVLIKEGSKFSLGLMDLDGFKKYNDEYGHLFGDEILKYVASTIKLTISGRGEIFRYGGDEFIIILQHSDKKHAAGIFKACNRNMQKRPFLYKGRFLKLTASYGIVEYPSDAKDVKTLIDKADRAMYFAKKSGRGKIFSIGRLKIRKTIVILKRLIVAVFILGAVYVFTHLEEIKVKLLASVKEYSKSEVAPAVNTFKPYLCRITLKDGLIFRGAVIGEDDKTVLLRILAGEEVGEIRIDKNLILEMR